MKISDSLKTGFSFGLTSGIITTLGLIVGLNSGTSSKAAIIGGILIIAIADAFSDALGIHVSEESENKHTPQEIWASTASTFLAKFTFALTFIVPVLALPLDQAIIASIIWGFLMLSVFSYYIARTQGSSPLGVIFEHLFIASVVIILTNFVGGFIRTLFQ